MQWIPNGHDLKLSRSVVADSCAKHAGRLYICSLFCSPHYLAASGQASKNLLFTPCMQGKSPHALCHVLFRNLQHFIWFRSFSSQHWRSLWRLGILWASDPRLFTLSSMEGKGTWKHVHAAPILFAFSFSVADPQSLGCAGVSAGSSRLDYRHPKTQTLVLTLRTQSILLHGPRPLQVSFIFI